MMVVRKNKITKKKRNKQNVPVFGNARNNRSTPISISRFEDLGKFDFTRKSYYLEYETITPFFFHFMLFPTEILRYYLIRNVPLDLEILLKWDNISRNTIKKYYPRKKRIK